MEQETEMEKYKNLSGTSCVSSYRLNPESITVCFGNGEVYEYDNRSTGTKHITTMKLLAMAGYGLGTYIEAMVKFGYARQLK